MLFIFAISKEDYDFFEVPITKENDLLKSVSDLRLVLANRNSKASQFKPIASTLYSSLVEPTEKIIGDNKELIIIPDGALHQIPFEVLLTEKNDKTEWKELSYLMQKHVVNYSSSCKLIKSSICRT